MASQFNSKSKIAIHNDVTGVPPVGIYPKLRSFDLDVSFSTLAIRPRVIKVIRSAHLIPPLTNKYRERLGDYNVHIMGPLFRNGEG